MMDLSGKSLDNLEGGALREMKGGAPAGWRDISVGKDGTFFGTGNG